jgi:hypothetical protein
MRKSKVYSNAVLRPVLAKDIFRGYGKIVLAETTGGEIATCKAGQTAHYS